MKGRKPGFSDAFYKVRAHDAVSLSFVLPSVSADRRGFCRVARCTAELARTIPRKFRQLFFAAHVAARVRHWRWAVRVYVTAESTFDSLLLADAHRRA